MKKKDLKTYFVAICICAANERIKLRMQSLSLGLNFEVQIDLWHLNALRNPPIENPNQVSHVQHIVMYAYILQYVTELHVRCNHN